MTKPSIDLSVSADVMIIGGGPAGMSAALVLGRARRDVIVIDEALPRNRVTGHSHGFLTQDGVEPAELRRAAREQIAAYPSVAFVQDRAVRAEGVDGRFEVTTGSGRTYRTRKLLFAVGMQDLPIELEGLQDVYGKSAFVCPYCDGWEMRDRPIAIIASSAHAMHLTRVVSGWTDDIALFVHGEGEALSDGDKELLRGKGVPVYESPIVRISSEAGQTRAIVLEDVTEVARTAIFFAPKLAPGSELPAVLGCAVTESGAMAVDEFGRSDVSGVFGAGDGASQKYQVAAAVAAGSMAAVMINSDLLEADWESRSAVPNR